MVIQNYPSVQELDEVEDKPKQKRSIFNNHKLSASSQTQVQPAANAQKNSIDTSAIALANNTAADP